MAIVVSGFDVSKRGARLHARTLWGLEENNVAGVVQGTDHTASQADISAVSAIIEAFSRLGFQAPRIIWDYDAKQIAEKPDTDYITLIAVGLYSNELVKWVTEQDGLGEPPYFQIAAEKPTSGTQWVRLRHA